jgi:hypothetical protein
MPMLAELVDGVIGVDTHRDTLAAAAVTNLGGVLAQTMTSADAAGYQRLLDFADLHLPGRRCWAVEGAGSFGAGLAGFLQQHGERVVEVARPKRPASRSGPKSDALDAVRAARQTLGEDHLATPRRRGEREALRATLAAAGIAKRPEAALADSGYWSIGDHTTGAHQPLDAFVIDHQALGAQLGAHSGRPVDAAGLAVNGADLLQELIIGGCSGGPPGSAVQPGVEPRPRHVEDSAQPLDAELGALLADEPKAAHRPISFAK